MRTTPEALLGTAQAAHRLVKRLEGLKAGDMISLGIYRELRRPVIDRLGPGELGALVEAAIARRDATALADLELVEHRLAHRRGAISQSVDDLPAFNALADRVA